MMNMIHALDIHISREECEKMSPEELEKFVNTVLNSMTPTQLAQMAEIGKRTVRDDILNRTQDRSPIALQEMANKVNVTVNKSK